MTVEAFARPADPSVVDTDPRRVSRTRAILLAGGALVLALATAGGRGRDADNRLFGLTNGRLHHPGATTFFRAITELGSLWASLAAGAALSAAGRRRAATDGVGAATAMWAVSQGLKRLFGRVRPYEAQPPQPLRLLIGKPKGASWPSAHPATLLAFVTVAGRDLELPRATRRTLAGLAGMVGASRVYLGVHYPADVAGGLLLGRAVADLWSRTVSPRILH